MNHWVKNIINLGNLNLKINLLKKHMKQLDHRILKQLI